jgi:hypothetical protein
VEIIVQARSESSLAPASLLVSPLTLSPTLALPLIQLDVHVAPVKCANPDHQIAGQQGAISRHDVGDPRP